MSDITPNTAQAQPVPVAAQGFDKPFALEFCKDVLPDTGHFCLCAASEGFRPRWFTAHEKLVAAYEKLHGVPDVYFGTAAFDGAGGRKGANVLTLKALRLDIDSGPEKAKKHAGKGDDWGYPDPKDAAAALLAFIKAAKLRPTYMGTSGGGGLHVYWALDRALPPAEWLPITQALAALCTAHGLKADTSVTTDTARILRLPGALHKSGDRAKFAKCGPIWAVEDMRKVLGVDVAPTALALSAPARVYDPSINADALPKHRPFSIMKAAQHCGALREAMAGKGAGTGHAAWVCFLGTAKASTEGRDAAHEFSSGHADYEEAATDRKLDSLTGGPASCRTWENAYGANGPCSTCPHRSKIKGPYVLGYAEAAPATPGADGAVEEAPDTRSPQWLMQVRDALPDWRHVRRDGVLMKAAALMTADNITRVARACGWVIRHNVMLRRSELFRHGELAAREDNANTALTTFGDDVVRVGLARDGLAELVDAVAIKNAYHPARDWVESAAWDGTSRLEVFYCTVELANDSPAARALRAALMRAWLLQGIGALYEHAGIAAQGMLTLIGPQGCRKTTWVMSLCSVPGAVTTVRNLDPMNRDSVMAATTCWIGENGEVDSVTRRADVGALKAFITAQEDVQRVAYARRETAFPRRSIYVGTANTRALLMDDTGSRRFWCLDVARCRPLEPDFAQQVWAEALALYQQGERWHLDSATCAALGGSNQEFESVDPIHEAVATGWNWDAVDWTAARDRLTGIQWMTAADICTAVGYDRPTRVQCAKVGAAVRQMHLSGNAPDTLRKTLRGVRLLAVPIQRGSGAT